MADTKDLNPTKETLFTLVAVAMFFGIVALIGISAWMRPAMDAKWKAPATAASEKTVDSGDEQTTPNQQSPSDATIAQSQPDAESGAN